MSKNINHYRNITVIPSQIALVLGGFVIFLAAGHTVVHAMYPLVKNIRSTPIIGIFNFFTMGGEGNLPSYFSALNLMFAGCLCLLIFSGNSSLCRSFRWHWLGLAIGLLFMSFDEASQIHEGIIERFVIAYLGRGEGIFYYVWYKIFIPIVVVIACLYLPFLKKLPLRYSSLLALSGVTYLSGSLGFEMFESYLAYHDQTKGLSILFEETLEMLGIVILIYALLLYLTEFDYTFHLNFEADKSTQPK